MVQEQTLMGIQISNSLHVIIIQCKIKHTKVFFYLSRCKIPEQDFCVGIYIPDSFTNISGFSVFV